MQRRRFLATSGLSVLALSTGCGSVPDGGSTKSEAGVPVSVQSKGPQPEPSIEYDVEMVDGVATGERPARIRITLSNSSDRPIAVGEERAVQFHHVSSSDDSLYLYPADDGSSRGPVEPGCWRLTEPVAVAEYYGVVTLDADGTKQAEAFVYGHPTLSEGDCMPAGAHTFVTTGVLGDDAEAVQGDGETTEFDWQFTLSVGD